MSAPRSGYVRVVRASDAPKSPAKVAASRGVGAEMRALGERCQAAEKARDELTDALVEMRMERDLERAKVRELERQLHETRQVSEARQREGVHRIVVAPLEVAKLHGLGPKGAIR